MADLPSGDPPLSGAIEGQQGCSAAADEHSLAEREQTLADTDQTASDADQAAADGDQTAADDDQAASDRDLAHGGDPVVHEKSRRGRDRTAGQRGQTAGRRYEAAAARDAVADRRDWMASRRDRLAEEHDRELAARDAALMDDELAALSTKISVRAERARHQAAADRALAAQARRRAAADRAQAAADRKRAARDRAQARADREALMQQLLIAETDALTGARTRGAGLTDLERELDRAHRTRGRLVVAYVDVVGLKAVNDRHGHAAGDALLQRAVRAIRTQLRSYDLIVRVGGDEFVCAMSGATLRDARRRFSAVRAALAASPEPCEVKVGFADLTPAERAEQLIARADADLPASPGR
ncbi:MAG TPA: GGDEF domain-containing protein [Solirubrobacteraceae bacterium]|jgi:diguanylate cyclase (GGDEF)-like protein